MNPFCVLFVLYLSKTLPHTSLTNKHTHMKICKYTLSHMLECTQRSENTKKKHYPHPV